MKKNILLVLVISVLFSCKKDDPYSLNGYKLEVNSIQNITSETTPQINLIDINNLFNVYILGIYNVNKTPSDISQLLIEDKTNNLINVYDYVSENKVYFYSLTLSGNTDNVLEINIIDENIFTIKTYEIESKTNAVLKNTIKFTNNAGNFIYEKLSDTLKINKKTKKDLLYNENYDALIKRHFTENIVFNAFNWMINNDLTSQIFNNSDIENLIFNLYKTNEILKTEINSTTLNSAQVGLLQTSEDVKNLISATSTKYDLNAVFFKFKVSVDNYEYTAIEINEKLWFTENLRTTVSANNENIMSYCYEGVLENSYTYGRLYKFKDAIKICPAGWHLPTKQEWKELIDFYGGSSNAYKEFIAGGKSKLNLPFGGYMNSSNLYNRLGTMAAFWTSTKITDSEVVSYTLSTYSNVVTESNSDVNYGYSVRCVK